MPTIDQLAPAAASADADYVPVSQGGTMRRVTRSQMLAGVQPALALAPGGLLGRTSAGVGAPEVIAVGANLQLREGVLSGGAAFSVGGLPASSSVGAGDVVAASRGGRDVGVTVGALLSGLAGVPGIDVSGQVARGAAGGTRSLGAWVGDAMAVEAFGAVGDGVTDDTAAFDLAVRSGRPVRLGARTYVVNGQWTITQEAVLTGVSGLSVLKRARQAGGAWISVQAARFAAFDVVFDAGPVAGESWGVLVEPVCVRSVFEGCVFRNATGATLGSGLVIQGRDGSQGRASRHVVRGCEAYGNAAHGIWMQATWGGSIEGCVAHDNGAYGVCLDFNDPAFVDVVRHGRVSGCVAFGNRRGISVGNYNETNLEPPRWGLEHPDAIGVEVSGNRCHGNADCGIAVSGRALQVTGNVVEANECGLLVNAEASRVAENLVVGPGQFGIDSGGSSGCDVSGNMVRGFAVGINPGGSRGVRVRGNALAENVWGVTAYGVETDGRGTPFGILSSGLSIEGNRIELKDGSGGGVLLSDAADGTVVAGNAFFGGAGCSASQALWAHVDQVVVRENTWNNQGRMICNPSLVNGMQQVQFPDVLDGLMVTSAPGGVDGLTGQHQATMAGRVVCIRVTAGGSGYSQASVTVGGSGSGARAVAYVRDGAVIGVAMMDYGAGYGGGASVAIIGDGAGAAGVATVGMPVQEGRRLRVHCNGPVRFRRAGSVPFQDNWTGTDVLIPQAAVVDWVGSWGGWQAVAFPLGDYLAPAGDGGLVLRSASNDVVLRPGGGGRVRVGSDGEAAGFASVLGRGGPEGVVSAPAGSDYRNLDGGAGSTLWIKRSGSGSSGWAAVG